jgi:CheY-like chemotaxis protein
MTTLRVLSVDDEPHCREVIALSLAFDPGLCVRSCASASEAIITTSDWLPDVILSDVMMPAMDGPMMLTRLRSHPRTAKIPIVFITVRTQVADRLRFRSLGAIGVIGKPFEPLTLAALVRSYLRTDVDASDGD